MSSGLAPEQKVQSLNTTRTMTSHCRIKPPNLVNKLFIARHPLCFLVFSWGMTSLKPHTWRQGSHLTFVFLGVTLVVCTDCLSSGKENYLTISPCGRVHVPRGRAPPKLCQALPTHINIPQSFATTVKMASLCTLATQDRCPTHGRASIASSD